MRKSGTLITLLVAVFIVIVFIAMRFSPRLYRWEESYAPGDGQPFGAVLFDSLMRSSLPNGYEVRHAAEIPHTLEDAPGRHSYLFVTEKDYSFTCRDCENMLQMAERGDNVMWVSTVPYELGAYLGYDVIFGELFDYQEVKSQIKKYGDAACDTLCLPRNGRYSTCKIPVLASMWGSPLYCDSVKYECDTIATCHHGLDYDSSSGAYYVANRDYIVAIRIRYGRGNIFIVTPANCFTNYGILDPQCRTFVMRMMSEISDFPVVRFYFSNRSGGVNGTYGSLDFFYRNDSLRLAWHLFLAGCVLLLVVNSRRRQRGIPLWEKSVNATADFLNQHASLYRKRTDHAPLLKRRFRVFSAELKRLWRVDVGEESPMLWQGEARRLASYLGMRASEVMSGLEELEVLRKWSGHVSPQMFRRAMELMQKLTPKQ